MSRVEFSRAGSLEVTPRPASEFPRRTALAYLVLGLLWILGLDGYLLVNGHLDLAGFTIQAGEGSAYVAVSALAVYLLARYLPVRGRWLPWLVPAAYLVLGLAWIFASDLYPHGTDSLSDGVLTTRVVKGFGFVVLSTFAISLLLRFFVLEAPQAARGESESRPHYHSLFEHNPSGVCLVDRAGRFQDANTAFCELFGRGLDELLGTTWEPSIEPDQLDAIREQFETALKGEARYYEAVIRRPDGERLVLDVANVPRLEDGEVTGVYGVVRDITPDRQREEQLAASEERFRALFEHSLDAVFLTRPDGTIEAANPMAQAMLGLNEAEIIERGRDGVVDTSDPALTDLLDERDRTGSTRGVVRYRRADGSTFPAEVTSARFTDSDGRAYAFVVAHDISERERRRAALQESEARHRAIFEHSMDGMLLLTSDGEILGANPAAQEIFHMTEEELRAKGRAGITDASDPAVRRSVEKRRRTGQSRSVVRMIRGNGETFPAEVNATQFEAGAGDQLVSVMVRDLTEKQERERQLAASEARLRAVFDHSMDAILLSAPDEGHLLECNAAAERLFGLPEAELKRGHRDQMFDSKDPALAEFIRERDTSGKARGVLTAIRADGSSVPVEATTSVFEDEHGNRRSSVILRDISESLRREQALRASEDRYRALFENSTDAILIGNPDGRAFDANPAAERLFGLSREELCDLDREDMLDPDDPDFRKLHAERLKHGRAHAELQLRRGDGTWFLADVTAVGFRNIEGEDRTSIVIRDITESKRQQVALEQSEERLRATVEASLDPIVGMDSEGRIIQFNEAAEGCFGYQRDQVLGEPLAERLMPERFRKTHRAGLKRYLESGEANVIGKRIEVTGLRADGEEFPAELAINVTKGPTGTIFVGYMRDVTEQRRQEQALRESEERFRVVADSTGQAIYEIDLETGNRVWAGACHQMFGIDADRLARMSAAERLAHVPEADRDHVAKRYRKAAQMGDSYRLAYRLDTVDGRHIEVEDSGVALRDRGRMYGVIQDVTEKRRLLSDLEAREQSLTEVSRVQQAILDALSAHIALLDNEGVVQYVNTAWRRFAEDNAYLGADAGVGSNYLGVCDATRGRDREAARQTARGIRQVMAGERGSFEIEYPCHRPEERRWFRVSVTPFQAGDRSGAVVAHVDISDRREAERQLELVATAFRSADEAMLICNADFEILDVNRAFERIIGRERDDAIGSRPLFLEIEQQERNIRRALEAEGQWRGELLQRRLDGQAFVSRASVSEVPDPESGAPHLVVSFSDVSELREYERRVDYLSYHDPLTGLPNRTALKEWFQGFEPGPDASGEMPRLALVFIDLDRLKTVNDAYGHSVGDELIVELGRRLQAVCKVDDYVARLIGDEFAMVIGGVSDSAQAITEVRDRLETLSAPLKRGEFTVHPTVCAGIAIAPEHGTSLEQLLRKADVAMHEAKRQGRGETVLFSAEMSEEVEEQLLIERQLRGGIDNREFLLHYQPSVELESGRIIGLEALVRWENPQLGLVPPDRFIPVAEDSGMIIDLGDWVFDEVCRQIHEWQSGDVPFGWVAVNLSPIQFQDPNLSSTIRESLKKHQVRGDQIRVEITENVLMMDPDWTTRVLEGLRELGIRIAVDDFGTGYSSLAYLKRFPVDFVKMDKTFIAGLPRDTADASIVASVVDLARRLGMGVVAEGIERDDQRRFLIEAGCLEAQGYYFSLPLRTDDLPRLLKSHRTLPVGEPAGDSV